MLHELLPLTRPLFVLDTETTGTDRENDRIIEIGFQRWEASGLVSEWRSYVNPCIPIPPSSTAVHGITDEKVANEPTFRELAFQLAVELQECDFGGQQIRFDLGITSAEMMRAEYPWSYKGARIIDSLRLEALVIPRDLKALYKKYTGQELEGAHGAMADVQASSSVLSLQLKEHFVVLPRNLDELHRLQWPGYIDNDGKFKMIDGVPTMNFGKWRGKPMRDVSPDYWRNFILGSSSTFSEEIKEIARAALQRIFPA